jgi:uncharacterized protein
MKSLVATIELLDEGATVPFIARYRKEATGNLDEVQIRSIEEKLACFRELQDRRATILAFIEEQGKLTPELRARIEATLDKSELEDLYRRAGFSAFRSMWKRLAEPPSGITNPHADMAQCPIL